MVWSAKLPELPGLIAQNFRDFDAIWACHSDVNSIQWWIDLTINEHTDTSFKGRHHSHALVCKQAALFQIQKVPK